MKQYPHFLFTKQVTESSQDADGNWSTPTESWVFHSICRDQTNGKGAVINGQNGTSILFASLVHLPLNSPNLSENIEVIVSESNPMDKIRIQNNILKYDVGQLHDRIWL